MLIKNNADIPSSAITSESVYVNRHQFMGKSLQTEHKIHCQDKTH